MHTNKLVNNTMRSLSSKDSINDYFLLFVYLHIIQSFLFFIYLLYWMAITYPSQMFWNILVLLSFKYLFNKINHLKPWMGIWFVNADLLDLQTWNYKSKWYFLLLLNIINTRALCVYAGMNRFQFGSACVIEA